METSGTDTMSTTAACVVRITNNDPLFCDERTVRACFERSGFPALFSLAFFNHAKEIDVNFSYKADDGDIVTKTYATYIVTVYCTCHGDAIAEINNAWSKFIRLLADEFKHASINVLANDIHAVSEE